MKLPVVTFGAQGDTGPLTTLCSAFRDTGQVASSQLNSAIQSVIFRNYAKSPNNEVLRDSIHGIKALSTSVRLDMSRRLKNLMANFPLQADGALIEARKRVTDQLAQRPGNGIWGDSN
jgi:hypothetical protein